MGIVKKIKILKDWILFFQIGLHKIRVKLQENQSFRLIMGQIKEVQDHEPFGKRLVNFVTQLGEIKDESEEIINLKVNQR